jgi:chromosome segregation protein
VRFYASDSEQDGVLRRQQEIDNISKQCRARQLLADEAKARSVRAESVYSQATQQLQELRQRVGTLTQTTHSLQIEYMKLAEVQERFNQRSTQISTDLAEIAAQESEQQQARAESEQKFEMLDMELAELQESHEEGQTAYLEKEQQLNQARQRLRDLELAAQEAAFAEKSHRSKMEELRRNIATALEQSAQLFASMQQGQLELESMDDQTAQAGLQDLLDRRSDQERALADARHELDQLTQQLRQYEDNKAQTERGLQPQRDRIVELQLKEQAARLSQEQYDEQLRNFEVDEVALSEKLHADLKPSYLQGEVTRLNNAIAALGAVNMAALDELVQAKERKTFLMHSTPI